MSSICHVTINRVIRSKPSNFPFSVPSWFGTKLLLQLTTLASDDSNSIHYNGSVKQDFLDSFTIDRNHTYSNISSDSISTGDVDEVIGSSSIYIDGIMEERNDASCTQSHIDILEPQSNTIHSNTIDNNVAETSGISNNKDIYDHEVIVDSSSCSGGNSNNLSSHESSNQLNDNNVMPNSSDMATLSNADDGYISHNMNYSNIINVQPTPTITQLLEKYKGKIVCVNSPYFPHCDIYLCGTLHVAHNSINMVQEAIQIISPHYVVLELCESRIDNLEEVDTDANLTFSEVLQNTFEQKTLKSLGMGLLAWMQLKAAKMIGSRLGGELTIAAKEAYLVRSTIVLGDRLYAVTIQRIFDKLKLFEKVKIIVLMAWELVSMSLFKLKDYISKTENDTAFVKDEIAR